MKQIDFTKPVQPIKVLDDLLQYANYAKLLNDDIIQKICNDFNKQNKDKVNFISVDNKTKDRVLEKQNEADVCDCDRILDFVRCSIICPSLESLFDFVNYIKNYNIQLDHKIMNNHSENPKIDGYYANNFALDPTTVTDSHKCKYPFIKNNTNIKQSEFMDIKLYLKIPIYRFSDISDNYMFTEILCTLTGFRKYYDLTHKLYEITRSNSNKLFNELKSYATKDEIREYLKYAIYNIHRYKVIDPYNQNVKNKLKMSPVDEIKEAKLSAFMQNMKPLAINYLNSYIDNLINQEDINQLEPLVNSGELKTQGTILLNNYKQNER